MDRLELPVGCRPTTERTPSGTCVPGRLMPRGCRGGSPPARLLPALKDGDSRTRDREFLCRRRSLTGGPVQSDIRSAGVSCLRRPGGDEDVLGGIDVPVVPGAAVGARPLSCPEGQCCEQVPARAARLGTGVPAVDHHGPATGPPRSPSWTSARRATVESTAGSSLLSQQWRDHAAHRREEGDTSGRRRGRPPRPPRSTGGRGYCGAL